jgi:hypothetical protein
MSTIVSGPGLRAAVMKKAMNFFFLKSYHPVPRRDSISRPIALVASVSGGNDTTRAGKGHETLSIVINMANLE